MASATKPEMSANRIEASSKLSATMLPGSAFRRSTMLSGRMLRSSVIDLGLGVLGEAEGVVDGGADQGHRGDGGLDVERIDHLVRHRDTRPGHRDS